MITMAQFLDLMFYYIQKSKTISKKVLRLYSSNLLKSKTLETLKIISDTTVKI